MYKSLFAAVGLTLGLLIVPAWAQSGEPEKGKPLYERQCSLCHGSHGKGDGHASKMLRPPAADLTSPNVKAKPDADVFQIIQQGKPPTPMAAFKDQLSDQQIHDVVAYIRTLGKVERP
jgi:mono/diheme cytochrome c family protein